MTRFAACAILATLIALPAHAALKEGDKAPDFTAPASMGGKEFTFKLADALKKGPVVLYFYPAAFTPGCTIEAHNFADAMDTFEAKGATVIGVSHDDIATLDKFSTTECRNKFPVAADGDQHIMKGYDAVLNPDAVRAQRVSYVISPDGKILSSYVANDPTGHVPTTMAAVDKWNAEHKKN